MEEEGRKRKLAQASVVAISTKAGEVGEAGEEKPNAGWCTAEKGERGKEEKRKLRTQCKTSQAQKYNPKSNYGNQLLCCHVLLDARDPCIWKQTQTRAVHPARPDTS